MATGDSSKPDDSKTIPYQFLKVVGGGLAVFLLILQIGFWALKQKPDELKGPPVTVTVVAELDPGMESESLVVQFHRDGGSFLTERKLPSGVLNLSAAAPKASAEIVLPGSGNVRYEVFGNCALVSKQAQGGCRRKTEEENDSMIPGEPIQISGNTTLYVTRTVAPSGPRGEDRSGSDWFAYGCRLQAKAVPNRNGFADLVAVAGRGPGKEVAGPKPTPKGVAPKAYGDGPNSSVTISGIKYEHTATAREGPNVVFTFKATNLGADRTVSVLRDLKLIDDVGNSLEGGEHSDRASGSQAPPWFENLSLSLARDVPVELTIRFKDVSPSATQAKSVVIPISDSRSTEVTFRNLPIPKPPAPDAQITSVVNNGMTFTLVSLATQGADAVCTVRVTNPEADRTISVFKESRLIDENGRSVEQGIRALGGKPVAWFDNFNLALPRDVPLEFTLRFKSVEPAARLARLIEIPFEDSKTRRREKVQFRNVPLAPAAVEPKGEPKPEPKTEKTGQLVVRAKVKVAEGVVAIVEAGGKKVGDWPPSETEATFDLQPGRYPVVLRSKYKGKYYKIDLGEAEVTAGGKTILLVPNEAPKLDSGTKW